MYYIHRSILYNILEYTDITEYLPTAWVLGVDECGGVGSRVYTVHVCTYLLCFAEHVHTVHTALT